MKKTKFTFRQIPKMLSKRSRLLFTISASLFALTTTLRVLAPIVFAGIIATAQDIVDGFVWGVLIYSLLFFFSRFLEELRFAFYVSFEQDVQKVLALRTIDIFFRIPLSMMWVRSPSENAITVDRGLSGLRAVLYNGIFAIAPVSVESVVLIVIIGLRINPLLAVWTAVILAVFIFTTVRLSERTRILQEKWFTVASANYKILSESLRSYETIRSFDQGSWVHKRYAKATDGFIEKVIASLRPGIILGFVQGFLLALLMGSTIGTILADNLSASERLATLVLVNGLLIQIVSPLLQFSGAYRLFIQGLASARQLLDLLATVPVPAKISHAKLQDDGEFRISDLTVTYDRDVILSISNLTIPEKKLITISGASGSGKSTFARCLAGLCEYKGTIYSLRRSDHIFYLTQDVHVFDESMDENIALSLPIEPSRMSWALQKAGITGDEYKTLIDRNVGEGGVNISGGQRQRIGLARMLYHNAEVLIFDEPTSALDAETACKVLSTLREISHERTCIIVTHDPRCVEVSDVNIQLENGRVN